MEKEFRLEEIFKEHDARSQALLKLFPETEDLTIIVLKGHLIIEEALYTILQTHCNYPEYLDEARLSFAQLSSLVKAVISLPMHEIIFPPIAKLNKLRNNLAHNLTSSQTETLAKEFVLLVGHATTEHKASSLPAQVKYSIHYVLGVFCAAGAVSEALIGNA
ncbi:Uncharacterised protein [Shewanella putrefaciens]|nr:Uncharacterised protein [Shewanella putrefaciens]